MTGRRATAPAEAPAIADRLGTPIGRSGLPGQATLRRLGVRLGITEVRDLLFHLPRRYDDLRELQRLGDLIKVPEGQVVSARVELVDLRVEQTFRRRVQRTTAYLRDETGEAEAVWFGRRFIERQLRSGDRVIVSGRLKRRGFAPTFDNPEFQRDDGSAILHAGRIVPVYRLTARLTARTLRTAIRAALDDYGPDIVEYLPDGVLTGFKLPGIREALEQVHYPAEFTSRDVALRRLAFDELLALQLGMVARRRQRAIDSTDPIPVDDPTDGRIRASLVTALGAKLQRPVTLTPDQDAAIADIRADLAAERPMLRLLQGDVGSGKTAVAAHALAAAALAGRQGALLAPTDLLARQHAATLVELVDDLGLPVQLLTGSLSAAGARDALEAIADGRAGIVVGTHALIQERVSFARLALVVIDEQHRFGVEQRGQLEAKAGGRPPHVLLMTATPIPRTLGQVLYADLDVSDLRTPPEGRRKIATGIRRPDDLEGTWGRVREEAAQGRRTFVIVPLIEDDADADPDEATAAVAAESEAVRLRGLLAPLRVGLVHGRMKALERDAEMRRFRDGELDVLVGTTVVEVGVDVPEATMMVIEGADRFGLAQLHQLRGRVGRGTHPSFCVLVSEAANDTTELARLEAVVATRDGFALAEADFELRKEGNVLGLTQHGLPRLRVASLQDRDHRELAPKARDVAERLLEPDGSLPEATHPRLVHELRAGWLGRIWSGEADDAASGA